MPDPLYGWKFLPWRSLFPAAALGVTIAKLVDIALAIADDRWRWLSRFLQNPFDPTSQGIPYGIWLPAGLFMSGVGIGALAVIFLEFCFPPGPIYSSTLWALVLCLMVCLLLLWLFLLVNPLPTVFVTANETLFFGAVLGVFWQGRRHW